MWGNGEKGGVCHLPTFYRDLNCNFSKYQCGKVKNGLLTLKWEEEAQFLHAYISRALKRLIMSITLILKGSNSIDGMKAVCISYWVVGENIASSIEA
ncbi:hypothetical protein [Bacillus sp. B-jedd]|uniref:hypothetical protein n=1 Tax=Bacillus sp. B-jedd TaxID=1476857 RepID=UPI00051568CA|nr:hypothetical protein [Bacillus sp. B-jedd]CEG29117.1 hypothetical protein BN1002_04047 [Bacillus sp. B-jedd]